MPVMLLKVRCGLPLRATQHGRHSSCRCYQRQFQTQDCLLTICFNVSAMWMTVQTHQGNCGGSTFIHSYVRSQCDCRLQTVESLISESLKLLQNRTKFEKPHLFKTFLTFQNIYMCNLPHSDFFINLEDRSVSEILPKHLL